MFKDAFIKLDSAQAERMTTLVNPHLDQTFEPAGTSVMVHDLSFYKGYFLAELSRHDHYPPLVRYAVCNDKGDVHILNWSNETIFRLNKSVPVLINEDTMSDYVRFFFTYVRGPHGRFLIIDSVDDIEWREEPAPAGRKALGRMIEPMYVKSREKDGTIIFKLCVVFKDSLFQAEAHLKADGRLSMTNEELLVEDIPVADDLLGQ